MIDYTNILRLISNWGLTVISTFSGFFDLIALTTVDIVGFGELSVLQLMFGIGFGTFVTVTVVKWAIGIIT